MTRLYSWWSSLVRVKALGRALRSVQVKSALFITHAHLESHEFMVRFGSPGVHLDWILQSQNQELDPLVLHYRPNRASDDQINAEIIQLWCDMIWRRTDFVVHTALELSYGGPALLLLHLGVIMEDLVPQPGQIVHPQFILLPYKQNKVLRFSCSSGPDQTRRTSESMACVIKALKFKYQNRPGFEKWCRYDE